MRQKNDDGDDGDDVIRQMVMMMVMMVGGAKIAKRMYLRGVRGRISDRCGAVR